MTEEPHVTKSPRDNNYPTAEGMPVAVPPYATVDFPDYQTILFDLNEKTHVATITINRPHAMNAWDQNMLDEFEDVWRRIRYDGRIHAIVLRASLEARAFGTGADIRGGDDGQSGFFIHPNSWSEREPGEMLGSKANNVWKPVICAIHGMCGGGAYYFVNESDILIASEDAEFFDPHVNGGAIAALEPIGLRWRMPLGEVLRMALMGSQERISAATAMRYGFISEVTPRDKLWERADEIATHIAGFAPLTVQGTVRAIWESLEYGRKTAADQSLVYTMVGRTQALKPQKMPERGDDGRRPGRKGPGKSYNLR